MSDAASLFGSDGTALRSPLSFKRSPAASAPDWRRPALRRTAAAAYLALAAVTGDAHAQSLDGTLRGVADNLAASEAEEAWRIVREQRIYDLTGRWIGRVIDVRSGSDGNIVATLRTRLRYGARRYLIPASHFQRRAGRIVLTVPLLR